MVRGDHCGTSTHAKNKQKTQSDKPQRNCKFMSKPSSYSNGVKIYEFVIPAYKRVQIFVPYFLSIQIDDILNSIRKIVRTAAYNL